MIADDKPSLLQDLWDRRFFQYIGTYLGVSFGLVQFAEFLEGRYDLAGNLVEKVLIFLVIMLPAVGLYIYNHGRKGHDGWKPYEKIFIPVSLIAGLGLSIFLFDHAEASTEKISITNEEGETITRVIPTASTAKRLILFPFRNNHDIQEEYWKSLAIPFLLDKDLEQDMRTYAIQPFQLKEEYESYNLTFPGEVPFSTQLKIAQDNYTDYFISGKINSVNATIKIIGEVFSSNTGELFFIDTVEADDIYQVVDEFTRSFSRNLYIKDANTGQQFIDLPSRDLITSNETALYHLIEANKKRQEGPAGLASAIQMAEKAVELDNRCAECYGMLSGLYLSINQEKRANDAIDRASDMASSLPERQRLSIGFTNYMMHEQLNKGILLLQNWQKLYPNDLTPYSQLMSIYRRTMEVGKAKEIGLQALENGHRGRVLTELAQLYIDSEQYGEAEKYLEEFSVLYPHKAKERSLLGEIYLQKGELEKARQFFEDLSILQPNEITHLLSLAGVNDRLGQFTETKKLHRQALETAHLSRDSVSIYQAMEEHYDRLGQYAKSLEILALRESLLEKSAPPIAIKPQILFSIWPKLFLTLRLEEYFRRLNELKEILPERTELINCIGNYIYAMGTENLELYEKTPDECMGVIMQSSGKNFDLIYQAALHELKGEYVDAARGYETYLDSTGLNDKRFSTALSKVYRLSNQLDKAQTLMDRLLKNDPSQPVFLLESARIALAKGQQEKAKEFLNKTLEIWKDADPEFRFYQDALELEEEMQG